MKKPMLIGMLAATWGLLIAAPAAHADTYSCTFSGAMGPIVPNDPSNGGVESILNKIHVDLNSIQVDPRDDGTYSFDTAGSPVPSQCLVVDDPSEASIDTGLYSAHVTSEGVYQNYLCGTMSATDPGPEYLTRLDLTPIAALGPGEDLLDVDYSMQFYAGSGRLTVFFATNGDWEAPETGGGLGAVNLVPTIGNCITQDVTQFQVSGAFTLATHS